MKGKLKRCFLLLATSLVAILSTGIEVKASYWLVIGSYRQAPGSRPEVSGITSPSLYAIPMDTLELCQQAGKKILTEIYKPVWQFDSKWTCIYNGDKYAK